MNYFRRLLEGEVHRPLLFSQAEPTDSISLTQSEPCVSFIIVYISVQYIVMFLSLPALFPIYFIACKFLQFYMFIVFVNI